MKELWRRLLDIADVKCVNAVPCLWDSYWSKRWEFTANLKNHNRPYDLLFKKNCEYTIVDMYCADCPAPENLIMTSIKQGSSIVVNSFSSNHGYREVTVIPRVQSIEELNIYADLHENRV